MGFPVPYAGVLPKLLLTAAISVAALKEFLQSLLESVGLFHEADSAEMLWYLTPDMETDLNIRRFSGGSAKAIRASLPPVIFDNLAAAENQDAQCAVCLCEFKYDQEVRQLPHCCHIFHRDCIDSWLDHDQKTCPLCRSSLVTEEVAMQEKLREQEISDELTSWFSLYHEGEGSDDALFEPTGLPAFEEESAQLQM